MVVTGATSAWSSWLETHSGSARMLGGVEGCVLEPAPAELAALQAGTAHLNVRAPDNVTELLRTRIPQVSYHFE